MSLSLSIKLPLYLRASLLVSCVALLFGLDTGTIGPVTTMPSFTRVLGDMSATVHGVVVSAILLPGAIAALVAGILADRHGRVRLVSIGAAVYGIGTAIECGAVHIGMFIAGRLIKGTGEGLFLSAVYVQVGEMSPSRVRGTMMSLPQFAIVIGIVVGFFMCYGTAKLGASGDDAGAQWSGAWRLPLGIAAAVALMLAAAVNLVPPSPRWLLAQGRVDEARAIIATLGLDEAEQQEMLAQSSERLEHAPDASFWQGLKQMGSDFREAFSKPFRARTLLVCFLMGFQQFSGIDGVLYYAPILFRQAGLSSDEATFLASGVSALVILAATVLGTLLADRWGRKTSSLCGGILITSLMLLMGSLYAAGGVHPDSGAGRWIVIVCIYLFAVVFNMTWALGFRLFVVESLPRKTRSSASSLAQSSNWVTNYIVALTTPVLIARSSFGAYYFFAFSTLFCTIAIGLWMYETRGHSLEAIEQRYIEKQAHATGKWAVEGFKLRRITVSVIET